MKDEFKPLWKKKLEKENGSEQMQKNQVIKVSNDETHNRVT